MGRGSDYANELSARKSVAGEIVDASVAVASSEVDIQIATAKRWPRDVASFLSRAKQLATIDLETAESCHYSLPARKKNDGTMGEPIEGPSIRLAEIVVSTWGNIRVQTTVREETDFVVATSVCWDLESNTAIGQEVRRSIKSKNGYKYSPDMIAVTSNAAAAIAMRNAVFKVVPLALCKPVYQETRRLVLEGLRDNATGKSTQSVADRVQKAFAPYAKLGVSEQELLDHFGRNSAEQFTPDDLLKLIGLYNAIKSGEASVAEVFGGGADVPASQATYTEEQQAMDAAVETPVVKTGEAATTGRKGMTDADREKLAQRTAAARRTPPE